MIRRLACTFRRDRAVLALVALLMGAGARTGAASVSPRVPSASSPPLRALSPSFRALSPSLRALSIDGPSAVPVGGRVELRAEGLPAGASCAWWLDARGGATGAGRASLVSPKVRLVARGERATVFGLEVSDRPRDVELRLRCSVNGVESEVSRRITCVAGDLTAYRPQFGTGYFPLARTAVSDGDETSAARGPGIRINAPGDSDPAGEDDLIELTLRVEPAGARFVLERSNASLALWTTRNKASGTAVGFQGNRSDVLSTPGGVATLWVEWQSVAHGLADLLLVPAAGTGSVDRVAFHSFHTIVFALGGEDQVPSSPVDPNHGTYLVGRALYRLGYDVHLYDEDNVSPTGAGAVYNEASTAIRDRAVESVVSFGYSHGGGSTYDLSERLDSNRATLGTFDIPFTSYVDGVENDSDFDIQQERRFPPGSAYHANHYQRGSLEDFFLDGGPVSGANPPPSGLDVETTFWGANANHFVVDDYTQVRDFIRLNLDQRVTP